jgi:hypothetical protein
MNRKLGSSGLSVVVRITLGLQVCAMLAGCGSSRLPQTEQSLLEKRELYSKTYLDQSEVRYAAMLRQTKVQVDEYKAGRRSTPPTIDYLVISGGGDFGAFGAGFLKGWATVPKSDPLARPRFDVVTGVSTGALIAPFAFLDDAGADQSVVDLYRNPKSDWVKNRWPLYFLPYHVSFARVPGLERDVKKIYSKELISKIADESKDVRMLFVNTTNLDDASPHVWYLVPEAQAAVKTGDPTRFQTLLLASSGIPGAFPHREIDGAMYVDGAVTANMIFGGRLPEDRRIVGMWATMYPDTPMPKLRYWVIFNNQLHGPPVVVRPRWPDIIVRSVETSSRTGSLNAMRQLFLIAQVAKLKYNADVEVRIAAVPDDWRSPKPGVFVKETMNNLADLGEKMGADPKCWITEPPTQ